MNGHYGTDRMLETELAVGFVSRATERQSELPQKKNSGPPAPSTMTQGAWRANVSPLPNLTGPEVRRLPASPSSSSLGGMGMHQVSKWASKRPVPLRSPGSLGCWAGPVNRKERGPPHPHLARAAGHAHTCTAPPIKAGSCLLPS